MRLEVFQPASLAPNPPPPLSLCLHAPVPKSDIPWRTPVVWSGIFSYSYLSFSSFCPSGTFPPPKNAVVLHPSGNPEKCINVRSGVFENGAIVDMWAIHPYSSVYGMPIWSVPARIATTLRRKSGSSTAASRRFSLRARHSAWMPGSVSVMFAQLTINHLCSARLEPVTHVGVKLWTCSKKSTAQTWKYDHDDEISLAGTSNSSPYLSLSIWLAELIRYVLGSDGRECRERKPAPNIPVLL